MESIVRKEDEGGIIHWLICQLQKLSKKRFQHHGFFLLNKQNVGETNKKKKKKKKKKNKQREYF